MGKRVSIIAYRIDSNTNSSVGMGQASKDGQGVLLLGIV